MCGRSCAANADAHWHMQQRAHTVVVVRFEIGIYIYGMHARFIVSAQRVT
jgi:hypothetical protein